MGIPSSITNSTNTSANSTANIYAQVGSIMQAQNKTAPLLNAALNADTTTLSGLGQLQSALASFQSVAQSLSGNGLNLSATSSAQITLNVTNLVNAYNTLNTQLNTLKQGSLKTDGSALRTQIQLASTFITTSASGTSGSTSIALAKIGITTQKNGVMTIDTGKLQNAISADPVSVSRIFTNGGKGLADHLASQIQGLIGPTGSLSQKTTAINHDITTIKAKQASLQTALTAQANALVSFYSQQGTQGTSTTTTSSSSNSMNSLLNYLR
jgi:flagellar hook-associated protein 2